MHRRWRFDGSNGHCDDRAGTYRDADRSAHDHCVGRCIHVDVEQHERNELCGNRQLVGCEGDVRNTKHGCIDGNLDLFVELYRRRRFHRGDGNGHDRAETDSHANGVTRQRCVGWRVDADLDVVECDDVHCVRRLDWHQGNKRQRSDRCVDGDDGLHADMRRDRRFHRADGDRYDRDRAVADADRIARQRSVGRCLDVDVEQHERNELYGIRQLVGRKAGVWNAKHGSADGWCHLYVGLHWRGRLRVGDGIRDDCAGTGADANGVTRQRCIG